jgi:hypothetical protein
MLKYLSRIPSWARMALAGTLMFVLTSLPDVPAWLWYARRGGALVIFGWAIYEVALAWQEFGRVRREEGERKEYMVAVIGFGLICVLLLVMQLLRGE